MFIYNYVTAMPKDGLEIHFLVFSEDPVFRSELEDMGCIFHVVPPRSQGYQKNKKAVEHLFQTLPFDVVWLNGCTLSYDLPLSMGRKYKVPVRIAHSHSSQAMGGILMETLHELHAKNIAENATHYFACSEVAADYFYPKELQQHENFKIISNAIFIDRFRFDPKKRDQKRKELGLGDAFVVGHVGRFTPEKNHKRLIEIFSKLLEQEPNAYLVLVGVGPLMEESKELAKSLGIQDRVRFMGLQKDVPSFLQAFDCFVMTSHFEGLPIVTIEAQAAGLPLFLVEKNISKEAKITEDVTFIPKEVADEEWARIILEKTRATKRKDTREDIRAAGYDIEANAKEIAELFLSEPAPVQNEKVEEKEKKKKWAGYTVALLVVLLVAWGLAALLERQSQTALIEKELEVSVSVSEVMNEMLPQYLPGRGLYFINFSDYPILSYKAEYEMSGGSKAELKWDDTVYPEYPSTFIDFPFASGDDYESSSVEEVSVVYYDKREVKVYDYKPRLGMESVKTKDLDIKESVPVRLLIPQVTLEKEDGHINLSAMLTNVSKYPIEEYTFYYKLEDENAVHSLHTHSRIEPGRESEILRGQGPESGKIKDFTPLKTVTVVDIDGRYYRIVYDTMTSMILEFEELHGANYD